MPLKAFEMVPAFNKPETMTWKPFQAVFAKIIDLRKPLVYGCGSALIFQMNVWYLQASSPFPCGPKACQTKLAMIRLQNVGLEPNLRIQDQHFANFLHTTEHIHKTYQIRRPAWSSFCSWFVLVSVLGLHLFLCSLAVRSIGCSSTHLLLKLLLIYGSVFVSSSLKLPPSVHVNLPWGNLSPLSPCMQRSAVKTEAHT